MKKIILIVCTVLATTGLYAQMPAAQRIPPAVEKKVIVDAPVEAVWEYISDPANYKELSQVKEFWYEGKAAGSKVIVTSRSGVKRSQTISMKLDEFRRMAYEVKESGYGLEKPAHILLEIRPADNNGKSEVVMSVMFGFDKLPDDAKKDFAQEFDDIAAGLAKKFK